MVLLQRRYSRHSSLFIRRYKLSYDDFPLMLFRPTKETSVKHNGNSGTTTSSGEFLDYSIVKTNAELIQAEKAGWFANCDIAARYAREIRQRKEKRSKRIAKLTSINWYAFIQSGIALATVYIALM